MPKKKKRISRKTKQLHINETLHKEFKNFCYENDRNLQEITEVAIKEIMKQPEIV